MMPVSARLNHAIADGFLVANVYRLLDHLRYVGDNDELYFRDYLNEHSEVAKEYETLKLRLWKQYEHNRDAVSIM